MHSFYLLLIGELAILEWCKFYHPMYAEGKPDAAVIKPVPELEQSEVNKKFAKKFELRAANLPANLTQAAEDHETLTCGRAFDVGAKGFIRFELFSAGQPCELLFSGSKLDRCKVAILCNNNLILKPPTGSGKSCDQEWVMIFDGIGGVMSGCGTIKFKNIPRIPLNGYDLYLYFNKNSRGSLCTAFCEEDLTQKQVGVLPSKPLSKGKDFVGFQTNNSCMCGKRKEEGRVVGGVSAKKFEFPWQAGITFNEKALPGFTRVSFCGASVINNQYILSAAHCFKADPNDPPMPIAENLNVLLHAHVMDKSQDAPDDDPNFSWAPGWGLPRQTDESEESVRLDIEKIIMHPLYQGKKGGYDWDLALLKVKGKIEFDRKISPICLPGVGESLKLKTGDTLTVSGWGLPREGSPVGSRLLQKLDVAFMRYEECLAYVKAQNRHLCAGHTEGGKDACQGDSGGPLIAKMKGTSQYWQVGVVSAGKGCARTNALGIYTNIEEVVQWIYRTTHDAVWCAKN